MENDVASGCKLRYAAAHSDDVDGRSAVGLGHSRGGFRGNAGAECSTVNHEEPLRLAVQSHGKNQEMAGPKNRSVVLHSGSDIAVLRTGGLRCAGVRALVRGLCIERGGGTGIVTRTRRKWRQRE